MAGAGAAGAVALVKEVLRLHHATTTTQRHKEIVKQLGDPPPAYSRERGYGMSMWLASACVALHEACRVQAGDLLATRSTAGRLERVLKVLKARSPRSTTHHEDARGASPLVCCFVK